MPGKSVNMMEVARSLLTNLDQTVCKKMSENFVSETHCLDFKRSIRYFIWAEKSKQAISNDALASDVQPSCR